MPTIIKGQPTSVEVIQRLKDEGGPVLLSFSCGKDSIAAWVALEAAGIEVVPVYLYVVPGIPFVERSIAYFEDAFGTRILQYPHMAFFAYINNSTLQPPERERVLYHNGLPAMRAEDVWALARHDTGLEDAWIADGVRASDSIVRRASLSRHGVAKQSSRKMSPIADWLKGEVMAAIEGRGLELPIDYQLFGRSFDGLDRRFIGPLHDHMPEDWEYLKRWFPLLAVDLIRGGADAAGF
jgi:hypothetical protein